MIGDWRYVTVGFHGEPVCEAWVQEGDLWNGWFCPYVTLEEFEKFVTWWDNRAPDNCAEGDAGEAETYRDAKVHIPIEGANQELYALGGGLVWTEIGDGVWTEIGDGA